MYVFFITMLLIFIVLIILFKKYMKRTIAFSSDEELDEIAKNLPDNITICREMQEDVKRKCEIQVDTDTKTSAYIFFQDKIILNNNEKSKSNFSRILFIAHECVHMLQSRVMHILNFSIANLMYAYDIIILIIILLGKGNMDYITLSIVISFAHIYIRMIMEVDAIYRSVSLSESYLNKKINEKINKNYMSTNDGNESIKMKYSKLIERYKYIIPKTIISVYISHILPPIAKLMILTLILILSSK